MRENSLVIKMELDIARERIINAFMINNEQIAEQVKNGIEAAVREFNFEDEIKQQAGRLIKEEISSILWKDGGLRKLIKQKIEEAVEAMVEKQFNS